MEALKYKAGKEEAVLSHSRPNWEKRTSQTHSHEVHTHTHTHACNVNVNVNVVDRSFCYYHRRWDNDRYLMLF